MRPIVTQYGFTTALGTIANVSDGDNDTFWAPYADGLDGYTDVPVSDAGFVLPGSPRPAIQFDFGEDVRIPLILPKTDTPKALGAAYLIASPASASSVDDTVQSGDTFAGYFTAEQMNSGLTLETRAKTYAIRARYWRFVFIKQAPAS